MDRNKFIELYNAAPSTVDLEQCKKVVSDCLDRCYDLYPQYPRGHMNLISTCEECAEFTEALSKRERGRTTDNYEILEEIGDLFLSVLCMAEYFGIADEQMAKGINAKMKREADRFEEYKRQKQFKDHKE